MPEYDRLWKEIINELFEEFLLFFAPDLFEKVDFSKAPTSLEQELHKIYPKAESKNRRSDKLVKVHLKSNEEQWILIHIEIQGKQENDFPKRMFQYFYRIFDRYEQKLYTIALYTDGTMSFKPDTFSYSFFGTKLTYTFNAYKILEQQEKELLRSNNPFALAILAGLYVLKSRKTDKRHYKTTLLKLLFSNERIPRGKIRPLLGFIDHLIELPEEETEKMILEISSLIEEGDIGMSLNLDDTSIAKYYKKVGREEGLERGRKEGIKETAKRMLAEGISVEVIMKVTGLSIDEVSELKK